MGRVGGNPDLPKIDSARAKELQKLSAKKRAQNKQERIIIREALEKRLGVNDLNEIIDNLIDRSKNSSNDFQVLRDTLGQKPIEKVEVTQANIEITIE